MEDNREQSRRISVPKAILAAWADLFSSRERILLRTYNPCVDSGVPAPTTLEEWRRRFYAGHRGPVLSDSAKHAMESKIVLLTRLPAAWIAIWSTMLPIGVIVWYCVNRILLEEPNWLAFVLFFPLASAIFMPILSVAGLVIGSIFWRPFETAIIRLLGLTRLPEPLPKEPGNHEGGGSV